MKITLCGSIKFADQMREAKAALEKLGHDAVLPLSVELNQSKGFWNAMRQQDPSRFASAKGERMLDHFEKVRSAEAILVLNYDKDGKQNYIGPNTFLEMGLAFDLRKRIFLLNPIRDADPNYEELVAMSPLVLNRDLAKIA